jgi:Zinc finger, C2H2 type
MPSQYGYTNYSSASYPSGYLPHLPEEDKTSIPRDALEAPSSYPGSYAPTPALGGSPALPTRAPSADTESGADYSYPSSYPFPPVISAPTSSYGYSAPHASLPTIGGIPYVGEHSHASYGSVSYPQHHSSYVSTHSSHYHPGTVNPSVTQAESMRVVDPPKESRCWEHGCNGRTFSTHSNLLRHIREKSGQAAKSTCPRCGAVFTRKTAMNGHMQHDKCKRKSGYNSSSDRSVSGGPSDR